MKRICITLMLTYVTNVSAGTYEDAVIDYQNKNYQAAIQKFQISSSQSNINAHIYLGLLHEKGLGTEKNYSEAFKYYKLASDSNNSIGQYNLANLYFNGYGVERNYAEALRLWKLSAEQGHISSNNNIATMYRDGLGVDKSIKEAVRNYKVAADKGNDIAQTNLGYIFVKGDVGVERNFSEAFKYFKLAADKGNADGQANLGLMYLRGDGVDKNLTEAIRLFKLATDQGNARAQSNLGIAYLKGNGVEKNYQEAYRLLKLASDKNFSFAQSSLAWLYQNGFGTDKNYSEALRLYILAAQEGDALAQNNVGWMYENGQGIDQDYKKAYVFYKLAERIGSKDSENYRKNLENKLGQDGVIIAERMYIECISDIKKCITSVTNTTLISNKINFDEKLSETKEASTSNARVSQKLIKRIALVIGNANYANSPLKNPINDANDISSVLRQSGFEIIDQRNSSLIEMTRGIRQFGDKLINADVGLVYYSGHGIEAKGRNYLLPVNITNLREDEISFQAIDVNLILEKMNTANKSVNILIVDACRDNPFAKGFRSFNKGLAQIDAPTGTIVAFATAPGKTASDGDGRNSPYTKNLVKQISRPNIQIESVFKEVRKSVVEETKGQQTPWESSSLIGDFYFKVSN